MASTQQCAFCPESSNRSGEHAWSNWISELIPGKKRFSIKDEKGQVISKWEMDGLNWKANVVCERCNNGWMSRIENDHAKPAMADLISGKADIPITTERSRSISLFAFKTAVVYDHMQRTRQPFFDREVRHEFRRSLTIPKNVAIWIVGYLPKTRGDAHTVYHSGSLSETQHVDLYVFSFTAGHLCIQVVGHNAEGLARIEPKRKFPMARIWPQVAPGIVWPDGVGSLMTVEDFDAFSIRWLELDVTPGIQT